LTRSFSRLLCYASRPLKKHDKNYSAYLVEMAAAVWGIEHFEAEKAQTQYKDRIKRLAHDSFLDKENRLWYRLPGKTRERIAFWTPKNKEQLAQSTGAGPGIHQGQEHGGGAQGGNGNL
jgi:hypothetical protein